MRRETVPKASPGSGLSGKFTIKFVVEYEQKYINGVDPTLVYMDIVQKALMFGTSKSTFYFNQSANTELNQFVNGLINGDINGMINSLLQFVGALSQALGVITVGVTKFLVDVGKALAPVVGQEYDSTTGSFKDRDPSTSLVAYEQKTLGGAAKTILGSVVSKYRIRFFGILQAMTGAPSAYWHVTIGNPKKPFFSCGDLYTTSVTMEFGKVLSYNDLPSTIKISFSLESARNLGGQEIMDALNTGQGRTYIQRKRSYVEVPITKKDEKNFNPESISSKDYTTREGEFKNNLEKNLKFANPGPDGNPKTAPAVAPEGPTLKEELGKFIKEWKETGFFDTKPTQTQ